ncbi:MAG TPA: YciI family protein [Candidatus Kapabacteria bacterium]|nr:YciI family protein [Candidatus Kapabacteria bacterium]
MEITNEFVREQITKGKKYSLVFLIEGPNYKTYPPDKLEENHWAHLRYLFSLKEQGKLLVNGPMMDAGKIHGMSIYDSANKDEVRGYLEADPAVQAGRFTFEIYEYFSMPGSTLS